MAPKTERAALLLRAVNVSGANRVPMAELRALLTEHADLTGVSTYIASGNIVCDLAEDLPAACARVRALIAERFGVDTPVIARTHDRLATVLRTNPFADASRPQAVHAMFLAGKPAADAERALAGRLRDGQRLALRDRELWIDYGEAGVAGTRLTTTVLDRALGTTGTARNVRTIGRLAELTAPS